MITEDYVNFEISNLLKEKGFQQLQDNCGYFTTEMVYSINVDDNGKHHLVHQYPVGVYNKDKYITAPTFQMVMKWLRNVHGLFIHISVIREASCWLADIQDIKGDVKVYPVKKEFPNYEKTCEGAIKYCLENLI